MPGMHTHMHVSYNTTKIWKCHYLKFDRLAYFNVEVTFSTVQMNITTITKKYLYQYSTHTLAVHFGTRLLSFMDNIRKSETISWQNTSIAVVKNKWNENQAGTAHASAL